MRRCTKQGMGGVSRGNSLPISRLYARYCYNLYSVRRLSRNRLTWPRVVATEGERYVPKKALSGFADAIPPTAVPPIRGEGEVFSSLRNVSQIGRVETRTSRGKGSLGSYAAGRSSEVSDPPAALEEGFP